MRAPANFGSMLYSYKGSNSIIRMAVVDHRYCFPHIDTGSSGVVSDGGTFRKCSIFQAVESNLLPSEGVSVGDEAFPLKTYLMKPYSITQLSFEEKVFNYRLS
jgi:hypothetical protein